MSRDVFQIRFIDWSTFAISYNHQTFVLILGSSSFSLDSFKAASSSVKIFFQIMNREMKLSQRVPRDFTDLYYPVNVSDPSKYHFASGNTLLMRTYKYLTIRFNELQSFVR